MQLLLVSVCLVICSSSLILATDPHYVIFLPKRLEEKSQEKVCVTIEDLNCELHLKIELKKGDHVLNIAEQDIKTHDYSHCFPFQVPAVEGDGKGWSIHVSGQGEHLKIDETRDVLIDKIFYSCVVQTDKSTYKPGDTVRIRLLSVDHNYHISDEKYEKILLKDPDGNFIGQWLDQSPHHGFVDLKYHLGDDIKLGIYHLSVPSKCDQSFTVAEYATKRFEVNIKSPSTLAYEDKTYPLHICGSYTYGKPVQGHLDVEICDDHREVRPYFGCYVGEEYDDDEQKPDNCITIKHAKTDSHGCLSKEIDLQTLKIADADDSHRLHIVCTLTEDGTGHVEKTSADVLFGKGHKIEFEDTGMFYQHGIPFTGKVKVTDKGKHPMAHVKVAVLMQEQFFGLPNTKATVETNDDGVAHFSLNTDSWKDTVVLYAGLQKEDGEPEINMDRFHSFEDIFFVHPYYSPSNSLISVETNKDILPCDSDISLNIDYHISKDQLESKTDHISFFYFTFNEDGVYSHDEYTKQITEPLGDSDFHGSFPIKVHLNADLSPHFFIHVYAMLPKGETLSGINMFKVSACFGNKVQLTFSKKQVHPGEKVNLEVSAEAGSVCSVRSIDKGYILKHPHEDTSFATRIQERLMRFRGFAYDDGEPDIQQCPEGQTAARRSWHPTFDPAFLFKSTGLILLTNTKAKKPAECVKEDEVTVRASAPQKTGKALELRPRFYFPDIMLFSVVELGSEGSTALSVQSPDTVTTWMTEAVCLGKSGIGEVRNVELVAFQTYFLDLITPYSVTQGEKFKIDVQLFSYEDKCILVGVTLEDSEDFNTVQSKEQAKCICEGHVSHFSWDVTALKPGKVKIHVESGSVEIDGTCKEDALLITKEHKVDSVEKTVVVKARGYADQVTETHLVCPSEDAPEKVSFTLNHPERVVPGTERAHIIVLGDLMGNVIVNLEDILPLPDGCGEQSSSKFARYCHALEYLQSTNQLTAETKEKFLEHMTESYQKELTFRNENGSFATFAGGHGDLWITGLVVRTLTCAKQFIHIDEKVIEGAVQWLKDEQSDNGCFTGSNQYFYHDDDEDHSHDEELLRTAFIVISLLEHKIANDEGIVEHAKACLCKGAEKVKSPHTMAFLAYAFTLLGDNEHRESMLKHLEDHAEIKSGSKYWHDKSYRYRDADVETTSKVILAHLSGTTVTNKDLEESAYGVRWLVTQQNPWSGFYSSKDTTIALQALGKYARTAHFKKGDSDVTIECDSGFHQEVHVTEKNSLLVQTVDLPKVPGTYTASVKGNGCVYIQSHLHFHSLPDQHEQHFAAKVTTEPAVCTQASQNKFDIHIDARYVGKRAKTNMAVIKVELLSGYEVDRKSIRKLEKHRDVEKVEISHDHIDIYLDELNHENKEFVFSVHKEEHVENLQPANILIYDYYVTEVHSHAHYNSPCVATHCKVEASERKDCGAPLITKEDCEKKGCCFDSSLAESKWCFFHGTEAIKLEQEHHSNESQETQQAH